MSQATSVSALDDPVKQTEGEHVEMHYCKLPLDFWVAGSKYGVDLGSKYGSRVSLPQRVVKHPWLPRVPLRLFVLVVRRRGAVLRHGVRDVRF